MELFLRRTGAPRHVSGFPLFSELPHEGFPGQQNRRCGCAQRVVLDDPQELLLGRGRSDGEAMEKLDHETSEALEGTRDSDGGRNLDEDALGGVDVDLQLAGLVDGRVEQSQETLGKLAQSAC